jgi:hypothetical protein
MDDTTKQANKIAIPRLRRPEQPPAPPKPARIRTGTVNKAVDHSRPLFYPTKTRQCTRCRKRSGLQFTPSRDFDFTVTSCGHAVFANT